MPTTATTIAQNNANLQSLISAELCEQFQSEGYFVLEKVVPQAMLQMLREECSYAMGYMDRQMEEEPNTNFGITKKNRYFIACRYHQSARLHQFIYSKLMAQVAQAALGPNIYLFNEQWVVKGPEKDTQFSWHQDSGYVGFDHTPYLTCWCPLDDVTIKNGTVYILPYSKHDTKANVIEHTKQENSDLKGYHGKDPGIPVVVPAGSVVCFSSCLFHRSGANLSEAMRRVYVAQYALEPIINPADQVQQMFAVPFVKDGEIIYDHTNDTYENATGKKSS